MVPKSKSLDLDSAESSSSGCVECHFKQPSSNKSDARWPGRISYLPIQLLANLSTWVQFRVPNSLLGEESGG